MTSEPRLAAYRRLEQITQGELAARLGTDRSTVGAIEMGRREMTLDVSNLGYSAERFGAVPSMSEPLHRSRASTRKSARDRAKELLRLGGEVYVELAARHPKVPRPRLQRFPTPESFADVADLAKEIRVGVLEVEEDAPIKNLTSAVERAGIVLVPIVNLPGIDGLSAWVEHADQRVPVIGLNPNVPGDRFRLTVLHEVGHLTMHNTKSDTGESEANHLARTVLIPDEELRELFDRCSPTLRDFVGLKRRWGISVAALIYGARELGLIDDHRYRSLQIQMAPWRRNEPEAFSPVLGGLLPRLVEVSGGPGPVGDQLGISREHIRDITNWSHLRPLDGQGTGGQPVGRLRSVDTGTAT